MDTLSLKTGFIALPGNVIGATYDLYPCPLKKVL